MEFIHRPADCGIRRIVFMGTPELAVHVLEALVDTGYEVTLAVTQPDRQKGRGRSVVMPPVKEAAIRAGIPVFQPQKLREPGAFERIAAEQPDLIVVAAFGQILPAQILDLPAYGCVNVHASLLPAYRGAAPIQRAVINGEKETGVTTMQMDVGLDTGDILEQARIPLAEDETSDSLYEKLSILGAQLLTHTIPLLAAGEITPVRQDDAKATYAAMLSADMGEIDWTRSAGEIERLVRGLNSWPCARTQLKGRRIKIWASELAGEAEEGQQALPGTVVRLDRKGPVVLTGDGLLRLTELQPEGKKRMPADAFLRGYRLEPGTVLGSEGSAEE